jgi:3-dehydroquinate synthetase
MTTIRVPLGARSYPIVAGAGALTALPKLWRTGTLPRAVHVVTDSRVAALHLPALVAAFRRGGIAASVTVLAPGERQKNLASADRVVTDLLKNGHGRKSALVAFGGGVVGDVTGFVAATFRRGIVLVQIPTTLLGQVESAIGGKTAVNHPLSKNAIGAYHQPALVLSDTALLATLPRREIICGLGEIVKYAMIDARILRRLELSIERILRGEPRATGEIIAMCNAVKARLIRDDEREELPGGGRAVLNLGHTVGHALEDLSRYRLRHGEAVVVGLRWELAIAAAVGVLSLARAERLGALLARIPYHPSLAAIPRGRVIAKVVAHASSAGMVLPTEDGVIVTRRLGIPVIRSVSRAFRA